MKPLRNPGFFLCRQRLRDAHGCKARLKPPPPRGVDAAAIVRDDLSKPAAQSTRQRFALATMRFRAYSRLARPAHQRPALSGRTPQCLSIVQLDHALEWSWERQSCF